jgi:hypothetical protein
MKRLLLPTVTSLIAAAALASTAGSALASNPVSDLARSSRAHSTSSNWSGYAAYNSTFTDVKGDFVVPTANCAGLRKNQVTVASPWVGLDGYFSRTVEQTGVDADCFGSSPSYVAWYEFYPAGSNNLPASTYPVGPGDHMHVDVAHAGNSATVTLQNTTRSWTFSTSSSASGLAFSSAEWILEAPTNALTNFGTASFSSSAATDAAHTNAPISSFTNDAITMVAKNGRVVRATPSGLTNGTDFTVQLNHQ